MIQLSANACRLDRSSPSVRTLGRLYKLAPGAMALDRLVEPAVDTARMCASAVISTPTPDRGADVLLPEGMQLENYRKNPVVLWEHGLSGIDFPIAKSEDAEGRLAISVSPAGVTATAYFTPSIAESEQIFTLIAERIIRGASVRALMQKTHPRRGSQGEIGLVVEEWDLEEWSWVAVPANPEALAQVLDRGRLSGRTLAEPLRKSLAAMLPERPASAAGWSAEEADAVELREEGPLEDADRSEEKILEEETAPSAASASSDADPLDDADRDDVDDDDFADDDLDDDEDFDDDDAGESATDLAHVERHRPLGARVLTKLHLRLARLATDLETACEPVEQPEVREHLASLGEALRAKCDDCRQRFAACYPRLAALEDSPAESDLPVPRRMTRFLAASGKHAWWRTVSSRLVRLASCGRLDARDARWLRGTAIKLASLLNPTESSRELAASRELPASLLERLDTLEDRAESLTQLFPAPRRRAA